VFPAKGVKNSNTIFELKMPFFYFVHENDFCWIISKENAKLSIFKNFG